MPVELNLVESVTELDTTVITVVLESASEPGPAGPGVAAGGTAGQVLTKDSGTDFDTSWQDATGGGGGVTDADYLVGTAHAGLSAEIVVGTSPGGELGGTWASPTVDTTHSGSSHAGIQAAAEATAAADLDLHEADTTNIHGITNTANLSLTGHVHAGEDITSGTVADARIASTIARDSEVTSAISTSESGQVRDGDTAGGVLGGTYPNPSFAADMATQAELNAHESDTTSVHGIADTSLLALTSAHPSNATFNDHSARHENGGADEISVSGLSGELADAQPVTVRKNTGSDVGTRSRLNFIEGSNVTLTVADDAGSDEIDVTIAASGSGGGTANDFNSAFLTGGL